MSLRVRSGVSWRIIVAVALLAVMDGASRAAAGQAEEIIGLAGRRTGLCVHLGCGREGSGGLTADLAAGSGMLVHGLAVDEECLNRARQAIVERRLLGQANVEKAPLTPLPYLRDLANVVVIEDFDSLARLGLTWPEVQRIVAPGGTICVKQDGKWTATRKGRPKEMDEWTHPSHGPDGNRVSADTLLELPVGVRWLEGIPLDLGDTYTTARGWVLAGGRCYTLGPAVLENVPPGGFMRPKRDEYLVARDAFNGLPLWKVNCQTMGPPRMVSAYNTAPLVADDQRVYVYKADRLTALDGETGRVAVEYPVSFPTERLLLSQGVLVSAGWKDKEAAKEYAHGMDYAAHWVAKSAAGAVEAFDARDGKRKWSMASTAQEMVADDGAVFMLLQSGNPPARQEIAAVDLQSGRERWRVGAAELGPPAVIHLNCASHGVLVVANLTTKTVTARSAEDGKVLWEAKGVAPAGSVGILWTPMVGGLLWCAGKKYDPRTGEVKGAVPKAMDSRPCSPPVIVNHYVYVARDSAFLDFAVPKNSPNLYRYLRFAPVRGACIEGATPAYGIFYAGQNCCTCVPGQVPGFAAFGPCGTVPAAADFEKARPVEKGPAFGAASNGTEGAADWPMYHHDAQRSGATKQTLPARLRVLWKSEVAPAADGPLSPAWRARLTSWLSAPVAADGKVFVAATDLGEVVALDAASGKTAWRAVAGARLDSPPAIHRGLCIFGAHDGRVSALSAADGRLAWRVSVARWERRMVAFGQVESVWPAIGAVLAQDGTVYASAGRSSESDGGVAVCALDAATGAQRWGTAIGTDAVRLNDVLAEADGRILWRSVRIDPQSGKLEGAGKPATGRNLEGLHDGTWTRLGNRRSGNRDFGRAAGEMLAWNDSTLFGYQCLVNYNPNNRWCFAVARSKTAGTGKMQPEEYAWKLVMPPGAQAEAMALCGNGLLVGGRVYEAKSDKTSGFLWWVSLDDGSKRTEYRLDSPPVYDGLCIAGQRAYVALEDGNVVCFGE